MIVIAYEFIELINIGFCTFDVVVLSSKVFGKGSSKEGVWNSLTESFIANLGQKSTWEVLTQDILSHILVFEELRGKDDIEKIIHSFRYLKSELSGSLTCLHVLFPDIFKFIVGVRFNSFDDFFDIFLVESWESSIGIGSHVFFESYIIE